MAQKLVEDDGEKVYLAISPIHKVCLPMLLWTLRNTPPGKTVVLLRIYQLATTNLIPETGIPAGFHAQERRIDEIMLREYLHICDSQKFHAEMLTAEKDNIELGLVELISEHRISTLIMGGGQYRYTW